MKIFLSHSQRQKPLIREIKSYLPNHVNTWLDEKEIVIGDSIEASLKNGIKSESDYIVLFIDEYAIESSWVYNEVTWALEEENRFNRTIVLPIVIEEKAWDRLNVQELKNRKYLKCYNFNESAIRNVANELIAELFALLSREVEKKRRPSQREKVFRLLDDADSFLNDIAKKIRGIVFGYRCNNPLPINKLKEKLNNEELISSLTSDMFDEFIIRVITQGYLSGIVFNGDFIFVAEEHFSWKTKMFEKSKKAIANKAISLIKSGDLIALDSGSTTLEVAKSISKAIKLQILSNIKILTNSIAAAKVLIDTLTDLNLDENNNVLHIYLMGGIVRPNTLALIDISDKEDFYSFKKMFLNIKCPDIGFVGVNGIHNDYGFSTHINKEMQIKKDIIDHSKKVYLLADDSKFGIKEEMSFCNFDNDITILSNKSDITIEYEKYFQNKKAKLILC